MNNIYIILDIETNGLRKNIGTDKFNISDWPRVIHIHWAILENFKIKSEYSYVIRPTDFEISESIASLTGISQKVAFEYGNSPLQIFRDLNSLIEKYTIVTYNSDFVINSLYAEFMRFRLTSNIKDVVVIDLYKEFDSYDEFNKELESISGNDFQKSIGLFKKLYLNKV